VSAKGADFLTPPKDRGVELRCYPRDPDGYLIVVGQLTGAPRASHRVLSQVRYGQSGAIWSTASAMVAPSAGVGPLQGCRRSLTMTLSGLT
jgi:hypothetical protein